MIEYNIGIVAVDGTIYGCISQDKKQLLKFLITYDHEGSSLTLTKRTYDNEMNSIFTDILDNEKIYKELEDE